MILKFQPNLRVVRQSIALYVDIFDFYRSLPKFGTQRYLFASRQNLHQTSEHVLPRTRLHRPILVHYNLLQLASPAYATLLSIRNFERFGKLYSLFVLTISGIPSILGGLFLMATTGTGVLVSGYGIACLYVWTLRISPSGGAIEAGLPFETVVHMHNCLRHVTILHSELAQEIVTTCFHHAIMVLVSTGGLYSIITEVAEGSGMSVMLSLVCVVLTIIAFILEVFCIYFVAMSSQESKRFLRELRRNNLNRYKQKILKTLLPNYITLEFISSANTFKNGNEMEYFANYFTRVKDNTVNLLLANK